jgi:hypothetical protein
MSRAREPFHHLRETLREALRREDEEIRPDRRRGAPSQPADDAPREGPEISDQPLGVPAYATATMEIEPRRDATGLSTCRASG